MTEPWVFGYGSLIWRPDFAYEEAQFGSISGWERRFWQGSPDHRGTPSLPGRVVTLMRQEESSCSGRLFRLSHGMASQVLSRLDEREKGGYERVIEDATLKDGRQVSALCYVATLQNPHFLGQASVQAIARRVVLATGPSGTNIEYVLRLADSLRAMGETDEHVFAVELATRRLLG